MPHTLNWAAFQCKKCKILYKTRHHAEKHQKRSKYCNGIEEMTISLTKGPTGEPQLRLRNGRAETSYE